MSIPYLPSRLIANASGFSGFSGVLFNDPGAVGYTSSDPDRVDAKFFLQPVQNEILNLNQITLMGGGALQVFNATGGTLNQGPVNIVGYYQDANITGNPIFKIQAADQTGAKWANAVLLSSLANNTGGIAYNGGDYVSVSLNTTGAALGDPVYLASGGGETLTLNSQIIGRVASIANPGKIAAILASGVGASGFSGFSGASGFSGRSGFSGQGISGFSGQSGTSGTSGQSGTSGFSGSSGFSGGNGSGGSPGTSGFSGFSGSQSGGYVGGAMERTWMVIQQSGYQSAALTSVGCGIGSFATSGATIHADATYGNGLMFSGGATSGLFAGVFVNGGTATMTSQTDWHPILSIPMWTGAASSDIQHVRMYAGFVKLSATQPCTTENAGTLAGIEMASFRYCPDGGVDTVGQWSTVTCDGVTLNVKTGVSPIAINTVYRLRVDLYSVPGSCLFWINDSLVATHSTNIPQATSALVPQAALVTTSTTKGALAWTKFEVAQD